MGKLDFGGHRLTWTDLTRAMCERKQPVVASSMVPELIEEKMTFSIHKCDSVPTRPCDYCLCFNGSCVFADFNLEGGELYIVRISFDGYGCYNVDDRNWSINAEKSMRLIAWIEADDVNHREMREILTDYFKSRKTDRLNAAIAHNDLPFQS